MNSLRLTGGKTLRTDRAAAWAALHDTACLRACIRNCLSLERASTSRFDLTVLVPLGPVSMAFSGHVTIADSAAPHRLVLRAQGAGGLAGLAEGTATLDLAETPDCCRLDYAIEAEPSGPIAVAGMVLLSGLARALIEDFGTRFAARTARPPIAAPTFTPAVSGGAAAR